MKKLLTITILLMSTTGYGQYATRSALRDSMAAIRKEYKAALKDSIAKVRAEYKAVVTPLADRVKKLEAALPPIQKAVDTLNRGMFIRYPAVWLKGKNGAIDTLTTVKP